MILQPLCSAAWMVTHAQEHVLFAHINLHVRFSYNSALDGAASLLRQGASTAKSSTEYICEHGVFSPSGAFHINYIIQRVQGE